MDKCFADNGDSCKALREKDCENCSFFKRKEDVEEEMEKYYKDKKYRRNQGC